MSRKLCFLFPFIAVTLLVAADPSWSGKRAAEWTEKEAWQILYDSPWAKNAPAAQLRGLTGFERRDGGNMAAQGGGQGMQLDRLKDFTPFGQRDPGVRPGDTPEAPHPKVQIRWETALPIRAAEFKLPQAGMPDVDGEDYAIAVYDVSFKFASIDKEQLKTLPRDLKQISVLKIEGRPEGTKEVKPSRVSVVELGGGMATVVYFFPRNAHITVEDKRIEFDAQIGRLAVGQYFYPPEMQFQGKLEL